MKFFDEFRPGKDHHHPHHQGHKDPPKQGSVLVFFGNFEIVKDQKEDEKIINRERKFDQIAGKEFFSFEESKKYDFIIEMVVPWYISFYASWYNYTKIYKEIQNVFRLKKWIIPKRKNFSAGEEWPRLGGFFSAGSKTEEPTC